MKEERLMFGKEGMSNHIEKLLGLWAFAVAVFHTLLAAFRYVVTVKDYLPILHWAGASLVAASVIYMGFSLLRSKESRQRVKVFFQGVSSPELFILTGLLFWFALSSTVNQVIGEKRYLRMEDAYLFDMAVCILVLFPMAETYKRKNTVKPQELLMHIVVILYSAFIAFYLWRIFHLEVVTFPSGEEGGFTKNVQMILGAHYNLTGMIAITMFCLCVYMIFTQKTVIRILYVLLGIVHLAVVYLSNSRTAFVGLIVFVAAIGFFYPWTALKKKKLPIKLIISIIICAGCIGVFWGLRTGTFVLFESTTHFSEELAKEAGELSETNVKYRASELVNRLQFDTVQLAKKGAENARKLTNLSNRTKVWKAALKVMGSSPQKFFFGVTAFGVTDAIRDIGGYYKEEVAHAHNIILQIGISMGVPAMLLFFTFLVAIAIRSIRVLFRDTGVNSYMCFAIVLCFTVINMGEAYLAGYFSVMACFFYLFCGWIAAIDKSNEQYYTKPEI